MCLFYCVKRCMKIHQEKIECHLVFSKHTYLQYYYFKIMGNSTKVLFPKDPPVKMGCTSFWRSISTSGRKTLMI